MRKCAVEYVSSVRLHKDTIAFTPWILWIAPCVVDVWIALEYVYVCFHSFTYSGVLILFINTSPLHFDVFLLMRGGGGDESKQSYASRGVCLETMILMIKVMKTIMSAGSKSGLPLIRF